MSEIKPVSSIKTGRERIKEIFPNGNATFANLLFHTIEEATELRAAYEALQKRNEFLEYEVKHLKDALRAYDDEDIDDE